MRFFLRTQPRLNFQDHGPYALLFLVSIVAVGLFIHFYDPALFTNDASQYLSVAKNYSAHRGLTTSVIYYEEHYRIGGIPVPQTCFPNGFPFFISMVSHLGVTPEHAAFGIILLAYCAIPFLIYECMRIAKCCWYIGTGVALAWFSVTAVWFNVLSLLSEMPFVAITLLSTRALLHYYEKRDHSLWLVIAGGLAALSFTIRYAGLFFIPSLMVTVWWGAEGTFRQKVKETVMLGALPTLTVCAVFIINDLLVGNIKGGNPYVVEKNITDVFLILYYSFSSLLGMSLDGLKKNRLTELFFLFSSIFIFILYCKLYLSSKIYFNKNNKLIEVHSFVVSSSYILFSVLFLLILEKTTSIGLSFRMIFPLVPFILIFLGILLSNVYFISNKYVFCIKLLCIPLILSILNGQADVFYKGVVSSVERKKYMHDVVEFFSNSFNGLSIKNILESNVPRDHPVFTNDAHFLFRLIDRPTVGMADSFYTTKKWDAAEVEALFNKYRVQYFVYFVKSSRTGTRNDFLSSLDRGQSYPWLDLVAENEMFQLYRKK